MCLMDNFGSDIDVLAVPYVDMSGKVSGAVSATFEFASVPMITKKLTGEIQGTVGIHNISYTGSTTTSVGAARSSRQGPVKNPLMEVLSNIYDRTSWLSSEDEKNKAAAATRGIHEPTRSNIVLAMAGGSSWAT